MSLKHTTLFITEPHAEQIVSRITDSGDNCEPESLCGDSLICIVAADSLSQIILTGEEMDNLAKQWLELRGVK